MKTLTYAMRIVQTFWSGGGNPLGKAYGWPLPEYNLISWTLSCLSLRRFYNDVELYTDREGYELLIVKLKLPYTRVHVVYDEKLCRPMYWAYAKIRTYSLQTEPFLHVDGDVYISKPFSDAMLHAPLVAQNREIGTVYYRKMIDDALQIPGFTFPKELEESICEDSVSSYNMGVFGGTDLEFIQSYCKKATDFVKRNRLDDINAVRQREVDCNILFEQVLFAILADNAPREVVCLIGRSVKDEGYLSGEFCNVGDFYLHRFYHILGGHKRNKNVIKDLASVLYLCYREYYRRIVALFGERELPLKSLGYYKYVPGRSADGIAKYLDYLHDVCSHWNASESKDGMMFDANTARSLDLDGKGCKNRLTLHPQLRIYKTTSDWTDTERRLLCNHLHCEETFPIDQIAVIPFLHGRDCMETPLLDVDNIILKKVSGGITFLPEIISAILDACQIDDEKEKLFITDYYRKEIQRLIKQGVLIYYN